MTTRYKCVHGNTLDEDCPECGDQRAEAMTEDEKIFHHDWPGPSKGRPFSGTCRLSRSLLGHGAQRMFAG
jgi:hypothetical protein